MLTNTNNTPSIQTTTTPRKRNRCDDAENIVGQTPATSPSKRLHTDSSTRDPLSPLMGKTNSSPLEPQTAKKRGRPRKYNTEEERRQAKNERNRQQYQKKRAEILQRRKEDSEEKRQAKNESDRQRYQTNKTEILRKRKEAYDENRDRILEAKRQHRDSQTPERIQELNQRQRSRRKDRQHQEPLQAQQTVVEEEPPAQRDGFAELADDGDPWNLHRLTEEQIQLLHDFDRKMNASMKVGFCCSCKERWPNMQIIQKSQMCRRCHYEKGLKLFSAENNMDPGILPQELQDLTYVEQMLIAQIHPIVSCHILKGGEISTLPT